LLGEREDAHRGEVGRAEFEVVAGPGAARLELAEVGVAGFQREVAVELVAAESRERGGLVVVGAFVDQGLAGAHAGVEAGVLGLGRKRGAAEQQGGNGGGKQLGTHGCLLVWGMSGSLRRRGGARGPAAAAYPGDGCSIERPKASLLDSLSRNQNQSIVR